MSRTQIKTSMVNAFVRRYAANNYRKPLSILYLAKFSKHSLLYETGKFISCNAER